MHRQIDKMIMKYLSATISHPTHSSCSGQSLEQGAAAVTKQLITIARRHRLSEMRKTRKLLWLCIPTQLFSQGQ